MSQSIVYPQLPSTFSQHAGGALAASFLTGMATGYSDPLSSAFDAGTYSIGDLDATSFISNRAGMLLGAAISCSPAKQGSNLVRSAGSMALAEVSGAIASQTEKAVLRQVMKVGTTKAAQKTQKTERRAGVENQRRLHFLGSHTSEGRQGKTDDLRSLGIR